MNGLGVFLVAINAALAILNFWIGGTNTAVGVFNLCAAVFVFFIWPKSMGRINKKQQK